MSGTYRDWLAKSCVRRFNSRLHGMTLSRVLQRTESATLCDWITQRNPNKSEERFLDSERTQMIPLLPKSIFRCQRQARDPS